MKRFRSSYRGTIVALWIIASLPLAGVVRAADAPAAAPSDKALVYLIQRNTGQFANLLINFDGRHVWSARANSSFALLAEPGQHEVSTATYAPAGLRLSLEGGETYYVQIQVDAHGVPQLSELTKSAGAEAVARASIPPGEAGAVEGAAAPVGGQRWYSSKPRRSAFILKGGSLEMTEPRQRLAGVLDIEFKDDASGVYGAEIELAAGPAMWGVEVFRYRNALTDDSARVDVSAVMFNLKKYFGRTWSLRPFLGIGAGAVVAEFEGAITGTGSSAGAQAVAGFDYLPGRGPLGLFVELKYFTADAEDDVGTEVDVGAKGAFAGLKLAF